jgi:hypothetical protein
MADLTDDGATATAVYFVSLVPYVYRTGDFRAWHELSAPACAACGESARYLGSAIAGRRPVPPSTLNISVDRTEGPRPGDRETRVELRVEETSSSTPATSAQAPATPDPVTMIWVMDLDPGPHGWLVRDFALAPDYAVVPGK